AGPQTFQAGLAQPPRQGDQAALALDQQGDQGWCRRRRPPGAALGLARLPLLLQGCHPPLAGLADGLEDARAAAVTQLAHATLDPLILQRRVAENGLHIARPETVDLPLQ